MVFRFIHAAQVADYRRDGWTCEPMTHHHGAGGYWLASRKGR